MTTFWHIDRGGFNQLKPRVNTWGGFDHPTLNIKALGLVVSDKKILKFSSQKSIFSLCDLNMQCTINILPIIKEGHIRINPAKFDKNPASSLGDVL